MRAFIFITRAKLKERRDRETKDFCNFNVEEIHTPRFFKPSASTISDIFRNFLHFPQNLRGEVKQIDDEAGKRR